MKERSFEDYAPRGLPRSDPAQGPLYQLSLGSQKISCDVILKMHTDEGIVGLGEASAGTLIDRTGESQENIVFMLTRYFAPRLIGMDPFAVEAILEELDKVSFGGRAGLYSKCAVDLACHDIMGKALGVPVYQLLGGLVHASEREPELADRRAAGTNWRRTSLARREAGYALLDRQGDCRIRRNDIACFRAAREAVGRTIHWKIDPNQAWTSATAIRTIRRLEAGRSRRSSNSPCRGGITTA